MSSYDLASVYGSSFGAGGSGNPGGNNNSYGHMESSAPAPGMLSYPGPSYEAAGDCAGGNCGGVSGTGNMSNNHHAGTSTYSGAVLSSSHAPTTPVLTRILVVFVMLTLIISLSMLILAAMSK